MANGTTRLAQAKMVMDGNQSGEHEYIKEVLIENTEDKTGNQGHGKQKKVTLKAGSSSHNHSF